MSNMFLKMFHLCFTNLKSMDESSILLPSSSIKQDPSSFPKNFNSLYDLPTSSASTSLLTPSVRTTDSDSDADATPDFATVYASHRFFFSSPGRSNSIIESPDTRPEAEPNTETTTETPPQPPPMDGGVAVKKYSPDPYRDFRFSMQEMIEARNLTDVNKDWDFLHELLICYLTLNPKNTHKFIVSAFADIIVCQLSSSPESDTPENHRR
ncbi:hypothetical protein ERO13_D09G218700v2 [Gossypium hirsutum]|uniref:Transcription repressor n=1 Tax=Gossypium hirsutum TaxID=3635 RepID=A0A1U8LRN0_GOSHI|nr:transcription repressor OFP12-like [Gossypium hirsutum]KAG4131548.1 hypothetical protein ERO13_D09G218700v2 [Gossypium hirsutum]